METMLKFLNIREQKREVMKKLYSDETSTDLRRSILKRMLEQLNKGRKLTDKQIETLEKYGE